MKEEIKRMIEKIDNPKIIRMIYYYVKEMIKQ